MTARTDPWPPGTPCWSDVSTPDVPATKAFYADVLGWDLVDTGEDYGGYVIAQVGGAATAGIGPQQESAPIAWTLYFASDDADATAAAVTQNGGTVVVPPMDVGTIGRMVIAVDPSGAPFGVWQAGDTVGAELVSEPGGMTWVDLRTRSPEQARPFYEAVFGFASDPMPGAPEEYQTFRLPDSDAPLGGIGPMTHADDPRPAHWLVYFAVADLASALDAVGRRGGTVDVEPFDTPFGPMAGVVDPHGAAFWVAQTPS